MTSNARPLNWPAPILTALERSSGARFYRFALQVNPYSYAELYRGQVSPLTEDQYIHGLLEKAQQLGIRAIAVTDHNHVGAIDLIRKVASDYQVCVFPGFEVASQEGAHILCIYDPSTSVDQLNRFLGELGIRDTDPSTKLTTKSCGELLKAIVDQGGISIAAHITEKKGILTCLHGLARINAWQHRNLLAVQIPGPISDLPQDKRNIVLNRDVAHRRSPAAGLELALAVVNAKDVTQPEDLEDPSATCWIKMSDFSIEGLRQAFLDPISRIRLNSDPAPEEHTEYLAIAWDGGFLGDASIRLNENLNVLIGGRGTGKSTIIESIRCAMDLKPLGDESKKLYESTVRHVLRNGTKISIALRSYQPSRRDYLIERTIPNPPTVRDEQGQLLDLKPLDLVPGAAVFGQHEISELSRSREKLTALLERFIGRSTVVQQRKDALRQQLERSRIAILASLTDIERSEEKLGALPVLEEALRRYQEAGLEERLREKSELVSEERILQTASDRLVPFQDVRDTLQRLVPVNRAFVSPDALRDVPGKASLEAIDGVLSTLESDVNQARNLIDDGLKRAMTSLEAVRATWSVREADVETRYQKVLRELQKAKVDGDAFIQVRQQLEQLAPLREQEVSARQLLRDQELARRALLVDWEDVKAGEFRELERAAKRVTRQLSNRVQVTVAFAGNREPLLQFLRTQVGGRLTEALEELRRVDSLSLTEFASAWRKGRDELVKRYRFSSSQAERLLQAAPSVIMQVEEFDLPATTLIELNVAPEGEPPAWQELDQLSTGQKATAILLLLLLESDAPLVVDQPEDDLDNRFVTEGIVPKMRDEKRRRQFIFASHNANIPVLGDAELIVGLKAAGDAGQGRAEINPDHAGSIDARPVRELVEELLEGGKDAFEMRRRKYGF